MKDALKKLAMYTDEIGLHEFTYMDHILTSHININWLNKTNLITTHKFTSRLDTNISKLESNMSVQVVTSFPFYFHLELKKRG